MEIDLVYLYVNSRDPDWLALRRQYAADDNNGVCRYRDNEELRFSLRSVEKYAPWIRNIYIVTDSAVPDWLNTEHPRLHIVRHEEILPPEILPCFNSNVIESFISKIPGLSEIFLYACDDMLFGNTVTPDFFVRDGRPIVRVIKNASDELSAHSYYQTILRGTAQMFRERYGIQYTFEPWHNIDVYAKTWLDACLEEFREEFARVSGNRMRAKNDIARSIFPYYMYMKDACILKLYDRSGFLKRAVYYAKAAVFPSRFLDFITWPIHDSFRRPILRFFLSRKPRCLCLNDDETTTDEDIVRYQAYMRRLFPHSSAFEKP